MSEQEQPAWTPEQAAQAVGQVQSDPGTDAAPTVEQMAEALASQKFQAAISGFESQLDAVLKAAEQQRAALQTQLETMQRQLTSVRAQAGPPDAVNLAKSLATRVASIASANPDLGAAHFAGVISQAGSLADEVQQVAEGSGSASRVEQLASGVASFFSRIHPRASGKVLEGAHAALDEAERIVEELGKLAPEAAPVAAALTHAL